MTRVWTSQRRGPVGHGERSGTRDPPNDAVRAVEQLSPRHQPDLILQVAAIPRTLTGKRMELPVKRVLLDPGAAAPAEPGEADALAEFRELGRQLAAAGDGPRPTTRNASAPRAT
jgi:hypothetical protein